MSNSKESPEELIKKAKKLVNPGFFGAIFTNKFERIFDAINLYTEAGNIYKSNKQFDKAAECSMKCAEIKEVTKENPALYYQEAAECYDKCDNIPLYNSSVDKCVKSYTENNQYIPAAKLKMEQGKREEERKNYKNALDCYDTAFNLFTMDKEKQERLITEVKTYKANLISSHDEFQGQNDEAIKLYKEIISSFENSDHGKVFAIDYYAKVVFCYLVYDDYLSARSYLHKYFDQDKDFSTSKLGIFLEKIIECFSNIDEPEEGASLAEIINAYKLENQNKKKNYNEWIENMIIKIKNKYDKEVNVGRKDFAEEEDLK